MKVFRSIQGRLFLFFLLLLDVVTVGVLLSTVAHGEPLEVWRQRVLQGGAALAVVLVLLLLWGGWRLLERLEHHTAELERSRDQLSLLAQITSSSSTAIIMVGTDGWIRVWNGAAEKLFGWPRLDMLGASLLERVVPEGARDHFQELLARASGNAPVDVESTLITREAGPIPVQLTVSCILDVEGGVQGHVCIVRDLREYKRLRESLVHSEKMAVVGSLVAGLSHELNNPLGIILGFTQGLLRKPLMDEASHTALLSIETQTQRCARLVRTLLELSRRTGPVREHIEVGLLLERVRELASGQARHGAVRLELAEPLAADHPALGAHMSEVESALLNLVSNALDATPAGGTVSLGARLSPEGDGLELFVTDTGSGMPPEVLQRIFDPFFSTKQVGRGTGLGLPITRSIVEAHGGRILVETALGAGTTVRLWFPLAAAPPRRLEASA